MIELVLAATAPSESAVHIDWLSVFRFAGSLISLAAGLFFVLAGTIGVIRLPDFYTRLHAAGMTDTLGAELILLALMFQSGFSQMTLKLVLVAIFLLITSPTATHAVAHAAHEAGLKPLLGPYKAPEVDEGT